jgi:hypothetical protein
MNVHSTLVTCRRGTIIGALAVVVLAVAGCSSGHGAAPTATTLPAGWTTYRNAARAISIDVPPGWQTAKGLLTPNLGGGPADPRPWEIAAFGTFRMAAGGPCAQIPTGAVSSLGPSDGFVWISERLPFDPTAGAMPPRRPRQFSSRSGRDGTTTDLGACVGRNVQKLATRWIDFEQVGREFYVITALGAHASPVVQRELWSMLNSLRVGREVSPPTSSAAR